MDGRVPLLRRTFRNVAVIAGLIERRVPGAEKNARQVTFSSDLIYDVLRRHRARPRAVAGNPRRCCRGLTDIGRLGAMLGRIQGRILHRDLDRVSPLAVPVLLEIGREQVQGTAIDELLDEAANDLIAEATGGGEEQGKLPL